MIGRRSLRTILAAGALTLASALALGPSSAVAETSPSLVSGDYTFETTLSPQRFGAGSYAGILKLHVAADGTLRGFFRYADTGLFREVVGGIDGSAVWLDLGTGMSGRFAGARYVDGKIEGGVYVDGQPYELVATPAAS